MTINMSHLQKQTLLWTWKPSTYMLYNYNRRFLTRRYELGIGPEPSGHWKIESRHHAKQRDSFSCGVFTLQVWLLLLTSSLNKTW